MVCVLIKVFSMDKYDVIVIGSGPAGASAAIYAKRNGMNVTVIDSGTIGGQLSLSSEIENYLGFPHMTGMEWSEHTKSHLDHLGIPILLDTVENISKKDGTFELSLASGKVLYAYSLILATGSDHRHLEVNGEDKYFGKGVSYCATCDGYFFKGKDVAVVGGGNTAIEYALFLSNIASKVYLIHRRDEFRAENIEVDKVNSIKNIEKVLYSVVVEIMGNDVVNKIKIRNVKTNEESEIKVEGVFIAIGSVPNNSLAKKLGLEITERGFIKTDENGMTTIEGVFAAGDVTGRGKAQAIGAAAEGMVAGINSSKYVQQMKLKK